MNKDEAIDIVSAMLQKSQNLAAIIYLLDDQIRDIGDVLRKPKPKDQDLRDASGQVSGVLRTITIFEELSELTDK